MVVFPGDGGRVLVTGIWDPLLELDMASLDAIPNIPSLE